MNFEEYEALKKRLLAFIQQVDLGSGELPPSSARTTFEELAFEIFRYQFENNLPYQKLCKRRGVTPASLSRWQDIPAVATMSFKHVPLFCGPLQEATRVFQTSGTTHGTPGKHYFRTLDIYKAASMKMFKWACLPDVAEMPMLVLGPTAEDFPHSSLGQMVSWILEMFGGTGSETFFFPEKIDLEGATRWLHLYLQKRTPVMILATSLALLDWCESVYLHREKLTLPEGSRILDTGGYKGRRRSIRRPEFLQFVSERFGLSPEWIFNEYGMTEMSSQFYETRFIARDFGVGAKVGPPWVRSMACDPLTLKPLAENEVGVLRHLDLANLDSVAMLQTEDLGRVRGRQVDLLGRQLDAEPRGCSLLAEEIRDG